MRTNIELDDEKIEQAKRLTGVKSKKDVVDLALDELIRSRRKKSLLDLAGKIEFYDGFDPKDGNDRQL
ncbi:MAG: type II toxin-antitoxin system VapB family antitoxin [Hyphomicrobiaceae bacterium]|nr:type II toxin-antitoxin system VapB family antitoxin [Hyphomicrobiaceae bacterium]